MGQEVDESASNPYHLVNAFIDVGKQCEVTVESEHPDLNSLLQQHVSLDSLNTSHLTLSEYIQAIDQLVIQPRMYFDIIRDPMKIGPQLRILSHKRLLLAHQIYMSYRDPRLRVEELINAEQIMDSILRQARIYGRNEPDDCFEFPLTKLSLPYNVTVTSTSDLPVLKWKRTEEDRRLFSIVFLKSVFGTLKKGWMINPELIRLLNIVNTNVLGEIVANLTTFVKSRITVSIQRLADYMFLDNFGMVDLEVQTNLIDDMIQSPIEERANLPQSDAEEVINFLNILRKHYPEFDKLAKLSRKIMVLTKPIKEETTEFRGFDSASDAVREILSVIHYAMNNEDLEAQIDTIYNTVMDPDFPDISKYYFDPSFELLHTPFLSTIQATIERMKLLVEKTRGQYHYDGTEIASITEVFSNLCKYLEDRLASKELIEIWLKINKFMEPQIINSIEHRSKSEVLEMIKGKEIILNIMTPLLLAKYEGRGYNPLAAKINEDFTSRMKSITGIIAMGSNFERQDLLNLRDTMFVEAPESKPKSSESGPPTPGLPKPGLPKPGMPSPGASSSQASSHAIPTKMGIALARIANEYVTGGGERNLYKALVDLIAFTEMQE